MPFFFFGAVGFGSGLNKGGPPDASRELLRPINTPSVMAIGRAKRPKLTRNRIVIISAGVSEQRREKELN